MSIKEISSNHVTLNSNFGVINQVNKKCLYLIMKAIKIINSELCFNKLVLSNIKYMYKLINQTWELKVISKI